MLLFCLQSIMVLAQNVRLSGNVDDEEQRPLSFVNILVYQADAESPFKGTTTDENGYFLFKDIPTGSYTLHFSYIGFEEQVETLQITDDTHLPEVVLKTDSQVLDETVVVAKLPTIKKTPGKLVFEVENTAIAVGSTMDVLKKTPGVTVIGGNIQVKFSTPEIYINGKRVYLSSTEVVSLLENTDATNIKSIEVITNPSAKYDAEAGTVLNIITSRAISIGYKGSVNTTYEQGIYPKYKFGTSHFYKNNWVNLYAGYTYGRGKHYKEDENHIRFFKPDGVSTKSFWNTDFNRTTHSENHSANLNLDFILDDNNTVGLTSNLNLTPSGEYDNNGKTFIYGPTWQLDSTSNTLSTVGYKKDNLALALDYERKLNEKGATLTAILNYIYYNKRQDQWVNSEYYAADDSFLRQTRFYTDSKQNNNIFTGQADLGATLWEGSVEAGLKYSRIDVESLLGFYDGIGGNVIYNADLSDNFNYVENIYAEYLNYEKNWERWSLSAGLRGEYTHIDAISRRLGQVNTQRYFDVFPSISIHHALNKSHGIGLTYNRSTQRPNYESLNPFRYYITENNYIGGNPNLERAIEDKVGINYDYKNKLFLEFYYQNIKNDLNYLTFQDNENSILKSVNANLIRSYQYSFDILFYDYLTPWWWFQASTSSYYYVNELYALESAPDIYKNDTYGQFVEMYNYFWLTKDRSLTANLTGRYISNFVFGNRHFKNQSFVNLSVQKVFWDKRASLSIGVDDVFNTLNGVASVAKYYNQDNYFYANTESRLLRVGFKYNFGNARLRDNSKAIKTAEGDRLGGN